MRDLVVEYFGKDYLKSHVFTNDDIVKLDFITKQIKGEDQHKIANDVKERVDFHGNYNIYTKNKLAKYLVKDIEKH